MNDHSAVREQVAAACHTIAAHGLVVAEAGNVSVRVGDHVVVTATNARFEELAADQVVVVDLDGERVHGDLEPSSELALHLGIYRRFGASAVVHTHAPMATAVGLVVDELPCVHYYMLKLGGSVRVAPYDTWGTPELAENVLAALEGRSAALMANHGAVTHAHSLAAAVDQVLLLEWACTLYRNAASMGTPRSLDEDRQRAVVEAALARMTTNPPSLPEETS
ncbi:class II aldolase/adducin family protein [Streptomyces sp. NBC_00687]|uniref:class II aldolase/adducin family protein n=1 Tax=Streptomyces sp. NBC_00687 TaxID=2975807 RepID=UPI0022583996|nr:class II aldolase/adducin family protein [Streptomyces sp. NBC_00687]MCX4919052.1 class II aldolase/adducin family protein [Streptomyces sp. NBC_00687]